MLDGTARETSCAAIATLSAADWPHPVAAAAPCTTDPPACVSQRVQTDEGLTPPAFVRRDRTWVDSTGRADDGNSPGALSLHVRSSESPTGEATRSGTRRGPIGGGRAGVLSCDVALRVIDARVTSNAREHPAVTGDSWWLEGLTDRTARPLISSRPSSSNSDTATAYNRHRYQSCEARPTHSAGRPGRFRGEVSDGWPRLVLVRVGAVRPPGRSGVRRCGVGSVRR